jgi:hypothetical protein
MKRQMAALFWSNQSGLTRNRCYGRAGIVEESVTALGFTGDRSTGQQAARYCPVGSGSTWLPPQVDNQVT